MNSRDNKFFQPILSVFGLAISLITSVLPLFNQDFITAYFIDSKLARPLSFISFLLGIAVIWLILQFHNYPYLNLLKNKKNESENDYVSYKISLDPKHILWLLTLFCGFFGTTFIFIGNSSILDKNSEFLINSQGYAYILFFISLIAIFSFLFIITKLQFEYKEQKELIPETIFKTLEKYRLIKPSIEIYLNKQIMGNPDLGPGIFRQFKVVVSPQLHEVIEFIATSDCSDIVKVTRKQRILDKERDADNPMPSNKKQEEIK